MHLAAEISTLLELEKDCDGAALLHMWGAVEKAASSPPNFMYEILPMVEGSIHSFPAVPRFQPMSCITGLQEAMRGPCSSVSWTCDPRAKGAAVAWEWVKVIMRTGI